MPDLVKQAELEHAYDRLAAYANVIKEVWSYFYNDIDDHRHFAHDIEFVIKQALSRQEVTLEDVGIDSNVRGVRIPDLTKRAT